MISNSTDAVGFTAMIATSGCEVGVDFGGKVGADKGSSVLRGEDDVDDDVGERLGHFWSRLMTLAFSQLDSHAGEPSPLGWAGMRLAFGQLVVGDSCGYG